MRAATQIFSSLLVYFSLSSFAQQQSPQPSSAAPDTPTAEVATASARHAGRRVALDVVVTDKSGNPVPGLQQQDFTVLDDKQPQTILSFRATNLATKTEDAPDPIQAILLVDAVNTSFISVSYERKALQKFLQKDGGRLSIPTSLVILGDTSQDVSGTTLDGNALLESLNSNQTGLRVIGRSQGFYGGADRVQISISTLEKLISRLATQPGRKLLIWLSPGWPLLSGPNVKLNAKNREWLFQRVVELSTELREARITLYTVNPLGTEEAIGRDFYYESFLKGVTSADKAQNGNLALQVLAAQSGGSVLTANNDIAQSIARCIAEAQAFYTLSFDSAPADHPNEYHSLQIKIDKPGFTARTSTGYYAQR